MDAQHQKMLRLRADKLLEKIGEAFSCLNFNEMKQLLLRWQSLLDENFSPEANDELQIKEADNWFKEEQRILDDEQKFRDQIQVMEQALKDEVAIDILDNTWIKLLMFDKEIPEHLQRIYETRRAEENLVERRRHIAKLATVCGGVVLVLVVIGMGVYWHNREKSIGDWNTRISAAIDARNITAAEKMFEELQALEPWIAATPKLVEQRTRLNHTRESEQLKLQRVKTLLKQAGISIEKRYNDKADVEVLLKEAGQLAVLEEDKLVLQELWLKKDKMDRLLQHERDAAFQEIVARLDDLQQQIVKYKGPDNIEQHETLMRQYQALYDELKTVGQISSSLDAEKERVKGTLKLLGDNFSVALKEAHLKKNLLESMASKSLSLEKYYDFLNEYCANFKDNNSPRFKNIARAAGAARTLEKVKKFDAKYLTLEIFEEFKRLLDADKSENNILRIDMLDYLDYYQHLQQKTKELKEIVDGIGGNMRMKKMNGLVLRSNDGEIIELYSDDTIKWKVARAGDESYRRTEMFKRLLNIESKEPVNCLVAIDTNTKLTVENVTYGSIDQGKLLLTLPEDNQLAPHAKFINNFFAERKRAETEPLKFCMENIVRLTDNELMNPYLRLKYIKSLLNFVIETVASKDEVFISVAEKISTCLQKFEVGYNWMALSNDHRVELNKVIESIKKEKLQEKINLLQQKRQLQEAAISRKISYCGINRQGENFPPDSEIWIINFKGGYGEFEIAGSTDRNGKLNLQPEYSSKDYDGMVLLRPSDNRKTSSIIRDIKSLAPGIAIEQWPDSWPANARSER
jgi:hypothetical protein